MAQRYGCSGLLIYSDPQDFAPEGVPVYPDGPSLPPGGVQRGSLMIVEGDPLTPGVPAIGNHCVTIDDNYEKRVNSRQKLYNFIETV